MSIETKPDPEQKKIISLYAAFGAGLLFSVIPIFVAAFLSLIFIFGVMVAAYILRTGTADDSVMHNHMTYVIRTIWIGSFLAILTMAAGSIYLFYTLNNAPLDPCIQKFLTIGADTVMSDVMAMKDIFGGCFKSYMSVNFIAFIVSAVIAAGPILLYFLVRYARGLSRALDGYRIARPDAWF